MLVSGVFLALVSCYPPSFAPMVSRNYGKSREFECGVKGESEIVEWDPLASKVGRQLGVEGTGGPTRQILSGLG